MNKIVLCVFLGLSACGDGEVRPPNHPTVEPPPTASAAIPVPVETKSADVMKGFDAFEKRDFHEAERLFQKALTDNPNDAVASHKLGETQEELGKKTDALEQYRRALKLRPAFADAAVRLSALLWEMEKYDDAEGVCRDALKSHPEVSALHANLALALASKGDSKGAEASFEEARKKTPDDPMLLFTYGHWLGVWGGKDAVMLARAKKLLETALEKADGPLAAGIGHEFLTLREPTLCIRALDKAVLTEKDVHVVFERGLCKLAAKDAKGAQKDFEVTIAKDDKHALAHYWLGVRLEAEGKKGDAKKMFERYLALDPKGAKSKDAEEHLLGLRKGRK